uniref:Lysozyme g n=1 Tax=Electrophorus electricus TaxID=8005 RepID=A0A4W4GDA9_ELEEL
THSAFRVNIKNIPTTGAGETTSKQLWNSQLMGKPASHALAEDDAGRMKHYRRAILRAAQKTQIDPAVIAAIISRETRGGSYLQPDGWNTYATTDTVRHNSPGILILSQVHRMNSPRGGKDSEEHITQACSLLADFIEDMNPSWSPEQRYKGGIAAYNCGPAKVTSTDVDRNTEDGDYANDVVARVQWYKLHGY